MGGGVELAGQVQVIRDGPVLDGQAVVVAEDVDLGEGHGSAGWGQAQERPGVAAMEAAIQGHGVVVGDDLVEFPAPLREPRLEGAHGPGDGVQAWGGAGGAVVVDEVGVDDLGEGGGIAVGEDLFQGSAGDGLEVVGDELQHRMLLSVGW